jgi:hypothetical protein
MPEEAIIKDPMRGDDSVATPNKLQDVLLKKWMAMRDTIGKVDMVLVNGDTCDGLQKKEFSSSLWTANLDSQVNAAAQLLKQIRTNRYVFTLGSGYHQGFQLSLDEMVSKALRDKAEFHNHLLLELKDRDVRMHFAHYVGVSATTWQYRTTPLARDMVIIHLNRALKSYGDVNWVIRGHAHYYVGTWYSSQTGFVAPAWQAMGPFSVKKGLWTPPDLGYVLMNVETDGTVDLEDKVFTIDNPVKVVGL